MRDFLNCFVSVYVYDILISLISKSPEKRVIHVRQVLLCLLENQLFVKAEKCVCCAKSLLLWYHPARETVSWSKIRSVAEWPVPKTKRDLVFWGSPTSQFPMQKANLAVPSVQERVWYGKEVWRQTSEALECAQATTWWSANHCGAPAPNYHPGQSVRLSTSNIPLDNESWNLSLRFIGPFFIKSLTGSTAVTLTLRDNTRLNPIFHVSQIKPVVTSDLCPHGYLALSFWILTWSGTFTQTTQTSLSDHLEVLIEVG